MFMSAVLILWCPGTHTRKQLLQSTRPTDMLYLLKDTLSVEDEHLFKACRSVCLSVLQSHYK